MSRTTLMAVTMIPTVQAQPLPPKYPIPTAKYNIPRTSTTAPSASRIQRLFPHQLKLTRNYQRLKGELLKPNPGWVQLQIQEQLQLLQRRGVLFLQVLRELLELLRR